jgi:hypothetical protein
MEIPTTVTFLGDKADFPTQKEVYIWLVRKFVEGYPNLLQNEFITQGREVDYFARSPEELSPKIAEKDSYYERMILLSSGRWFVNVKLDNPQKLKILSRMAKQAGLEGSDWSWHNDGKKSTHAKQREALDRAYSEIEI